MLKLNELKVKYNDNTIINKVSYNFLPGNIYILTGENGSGKSTLLKSIAGLLKYEGKINKDCILGFLPDKPSFPSLLSAKEYLKSIGKLNNTEDETSEYMAVLSLENKIIGSLSKGNLQKVGIIQLFLLDADTYLLDEPFDGLDNDAKIGLKKIILKKKDENKIIILSLHDKKIFSSKDAKYIEIREGKIYEKKDKKSKTVENIL